MARKPINLKPTTGPQVPDADFVDQKIRELQQKVTPKKRKKPLSPGANPELWPGGPGVDTGDIRLT